MRDRLKSNLGGKIEGAIDAEFFFADRIYHNYAFIKPWLEKGLHVISDRYDLSTLAYQSVQGLDFGYLLQKRESLRKLNLIEKPTATLFFNISVDNAIKRIQGTGKELEKFENREFLTKLVNSYSELMKTEENIFIIDAEQNLENVVDSACEKIRKILTNHPINSSG